MSSTIPAVGYLRRSTNKQEKSLSDQRREIERYATQHGYEIIRWYTDDAISGDATEKRAGFQAMHTDACNGRDFECILVWDQDRFGRFNSLEAGYWIHPLVKAGVRLVTVTEGPINWTDFTGRLIYSMKQEGKHQFLVDLSRNTLRGQASTAKAGYLNGQRAPYAYDRMLVDEHGNHVQRIADGSQIARPKSWKMTLVPSEDPEKVSTAKWLFDQYASLDVGVRSLADDLNRRGIPGPTGGGWRASTVNAILRNPAYCGDLAWARRRTGKYHRVSAGGIHARQSHNGADNRNAPEEWIVKRDAHAALVDRETWDRVQEKLAERKWRTGPHKARNGDPYLLSGMVYCGHCGRKMHGSVFSCRRGRKVYRYQKYVCSTYKSFGTSTGCRCHTVNQKALVTLLLGKLRDAVLAGGHRDALREKIVERLESRRKADPERVKALREKVAELDVEIKQGTRKLLACPEDVTDLLAAELSALRRKRDRLAAELSDLGRQTAPADVGAEADALVGRIWTLDEELQHAQPARLRELLRRMVSRIDLWFDHVPKGKRVECPLSRGTIDLRPDPIFVGLVQHGDTYWTHNTNCPP